MKTSRIKRIGAGVLAAVMTATAYVGTTVNVSASDSWPNPTASAEPTFAGYRVKDVENWSPETDPYAEFMRAEVPLQKRNEAFKPTQAKPYLNSDAQIMLMQGDYGNSFFGSTMYTDKFGEHVLNFWQYADYFSPWHGAATAYTPESLYDPITSDWQRRGFEFGIVNIPNPAYTNAAHKNGVMSIACIYFDPAFRPGQTCDDLVEKDENGEFSIADKLIQMAEYMGFDGYFLNQEEGYENDFKPFMAKLSEAGLYTQWYDTNNYFDYDKAEWLKDWEYEKINDSVFINYGWNADWTQRENSEYYSSEYADESLEYAEYMKFDPFKNLFFGLECNQNKFNGNHDSAKYVSALYDETGNPRASIALFTPSDWYQRGVDEIPAYDDQKTPVMQQTEYQWMVAERERMFFSGVKSDPTDTGLKPGYSRPEVGVDDASGWVGVADFISERSVIDGTAFYTNFNTGHGVQYFKNGKVSADKEWTNINIQDILPSWQWWMDSSDDTKLSADFDYGAKLVNNDKDGNPMTMPYTQIGAYDGGSSLVVYGNLTGSDTLHLYKTDLEVKDTTKVDVTFKKTSDDDAQMKLGLIFKDKPEETVKLDIANAQTKGEWTTSQVDLSAYAGRNIAAITLEFEGTAANYQMNVGGLKVSDSTYKPAAPTGFTVDYAYADGQMIVSWDLPEDNYGNVVQYNLYGTLSDGRRVYLGGTYDSILYVKSMFDEAKVVDLELCAVGKDGTESDPAKATYSYEDKVSNITVKEAKTPSGLLVRAANSGKLEISFDAPATGTPDSYEFEVTLRNIASDDPDNQVYTYTTEGTVTSAEIPLPVKEGYEYDLKIYAVKDGEKGDAICYRGWSNDSYSEPIDAEDIRVSGRRVRLVDPDSVDWYKMTATFEGEETASFTRGAVERFTATMRFNIPDNATGTLSVVVEDFAGNKSEPTVVKLENGVIKVDKETLQAVYDENRDRVEEDYTTETWAAFKAALDNAAAVLANEEATQEDVDNAAAELERTAAALVERGNKYDLEALIQYVKDAQQEESYQYLIPAVKVPLEAALAEAEEVMADVDATQETIDNAFNELNKWRDYLAFTGNKTELQALYDLAAALELDAYTDKTAEAVKVAMEAAKAVLDNENALQADIDEAYKALNDAVTGLKQKVDKEALGELIEKAEAIDLSKYLESSQTDFAGALENAKAVFADEDATAKEVYDAYNRLQKAIFDLRLIPDKSLLEDLLNKATEVDESKYTAESYGVLKAAMAEAKVVFEDKEATETEVKAAETKLENALDGLVLTDAGETPEEPANPEEKPNNPDKENPNTDDSIPYAVPMALVLAAGAVFIIRKRAMR